MHQMSIGFEIVGRGHRVEKACEVGTSAYLLQVVILLQAMGQGERINVEPRVLQFAHRGKNSLMLFEIEFARRQINPVKAGRIKQDRAQ